MDKIDLVFEKREYGNVFDLYNEIILGLNLCIGYYFLISIDDKEVNSKYFFI